MTYVINTITIGTLFLATATLMSGCVSKPAVIHDPVEVAVVQTVPCIKLEDIPTCAQSLVDTTDLRGKGMYVQTQTILQDLENDRACKRELQAVLTRCIETKK
jgi:PBP1b-binding outer membrane lipoprotein LpoB